MDRRTITRRECSISFDRLSPSRDSRAYRLAIGLFGLVGMFGVLIGPFTGRLIDNLVPWYATLIATSALLVFQSVQTVGGGINVSAVVIACFGLDAARQMQQVSLSTAVFRYISLAMAVNNMITIVTE